MACVIKSGLKAEDWAWVPTRPMCVVCGQRVLCRWLCPRPIPEGREACSLGICRNKLTRYLASRKHCLFGASWYFRAVCRKSRIIALCACETPLDELVSLGKRWDWYGALRVWCRRESRLYCVSHEIATQTYNVSKVTCVISSCRSIMHIQISRRRASRDLPI